jgi:hypothetical protein
MSEWVNYNNNKTRQQPMLTKREHWILSYQPLSVLPSVTDRSFILSVTSSLVDMMVTYWVWLIQVQNNNKDNDNIGVIKIETTTNTTIITIIRSSFACCFCFCVDYYGPFKFLGLRSNAVCVLPDWLIRFIWNGGERLPHVWGDSWMDGQTASGWNAHLHDWLIPLF